MSNSIQVGVEEAGGTGATMGTMARAHDGEGRIDDIEILRAVAVVFVLVWHVPGNLFFWLNLWRPRYFGGWDGVDLFFAISGFVIARSLMPRLSAAVDTTKFINTAIAFWIRRAWRLLPSAWLWLLVILIAVLFFNASGAFGDFQANFEATIAAVLDLANWRIHVVFGQSPLGISVPYWTLSLEEQFYMLFPFLVLISGKRLPFVLGAGVLLQIFIPRSGVWVQDPTFELFRSDALLLGVLIALWSKHPTYKLFEPVFLKDRPVRSIALFIFLIFLLGVAGSNALRIVGGFQMGLIALISALLVLIASYDNGYYCPNGVLKRMLLWFGSRSYGLYIIHIPVFCVTREIWFRLQLPGTIYTDRFSVRFTYTAVILLLVLVELNYRFVEIPLRRHGKRVSERIAARIAS